MTLSITTICHYAECRDIFIVMQNVVMLSVIMPSVVAPQNNPVGRIFLHPSENTYVILASWQDGKLIKW